MGVLRDNGTSEWQRDVLLRLVVGGREVAN
jgi:hypothetical protein